MLKEDITEPDNRVVINAGSQKGATFYKACTLRQYRNLHCSDVLCR